MNLFDRSTLSRPKLAGWRDASARFLHDQATSGMPMSLASLKATCDAAAAELRACETRSKRVPRAMRSIAPLLPLAGASAYLT